MRKLFYSFVMCLLAGMMVSCNEEAYNFVEPENAVIKETVVPEMKSANGQKVSTIDDIVNWTGTGENRSVLSIQWAEAAGSANSVRFLAWGYKWNGSAVGLDMITAVAKQDSRLYVVLAEAWNQIVIKGFGYDGNGDGHITVSNASLTLTEADFVDGIYIEKSGDDFDDMKTADAADLWMGGWKHAYASYWVGTPGVNVPASFSYSNFAASSQKLQNNSWDAWTFSTINSSHVNVKPRPDLLEAAPMN